MATNLTSGKSTSRFTVVGPYSWSNQIYAPSDPANACGRIVFSAPFQATACAEA